jgi:hypothetical protein
VEYFWTLLFGIIYATKKQLIGNQNNTTVEYAVCRFEVMLYIELCTGNSKKSKRVKLQLKVPKTWKVNMESS